MSKAFKIEIKGQPWMVRLLSNKQFIKKHDGTAKAYTMPDTREIDFNKNYLSLGAIRHEIFHAMVTESNTESATLDAYQTEELAASIIQHEWNKIQTLAEQLINEFTSKEEK